MCGSGFVFLAGSLLPRARGPHRSLADVTGGRRHCRQPGCEMPAFAANQANARFPRSRCFCLRLIGTADHFSPHQFSSSGGSCLPGTQSRILMKFVAEPGLRDGGVTNPGTRLLRNPGRELATGRFYIVWRRRDLFSGMQFHILKSVINGNCQFSLISARDYCWA